MDKSLALETMTLTSLADGIRPVKLLAKKCD